MDKETIRNFFKIGKGILMNERGGGCGDGIFGPKWKYAKCHRYIFKEHEWSATEGENGVPVIDECIFYTADGGRHIGPVCIRCGYQFCTECNPNGYTFKHPECVVEGWSCPTCGGKVTLYQSPCPKCGQELRYDSNELIDTWREN